MISIIVPVYCGAKTIEELHNRIDRVMQRHAELGGYELIFVDDYSPDNSFEVIQRIVTKSNRVLGIKLAKNFGQQNATYAGLHYAQGDVIVTMDDDLQHEPELLPSLISKLNQNVDLVYGVFMERQDGEYRRLGSKLTAQFFKIQFPVLRGNRVSSFRVFTKDLRNKIIHNEYGFIYLSCLLLNHCKAVENVRIPFIPRAQGRSNYNVKKLIKLFIELNLNYGVLKRVYRRFFKEKTACFEVGVCIGQTAQGVKSYENNDAGWRNQSAMCN